MHQNQMTDSCSCTFDTFCHFWRKLASYRPPSLRSVAVLLPGVSGMPLSEVPSAPTSLPRRRRSHLIHPHGASDQIPSLSRSDHHRDHGRRHNCTDRHCSRQQRQHWPAAAHGSTNRRGRVAPSWAQMSCRRTFSFTPKIMRPVEHRMEKFHFCSRK